MKLKGYSSLKGTHENLPRYLKIKDKKRMTQKMTQMFIKAQRVT